MFCAAIDSMPSIDPSSSRIPQPHLSHSLPPSLSPHPLSRQVAGKSGKPEEETVRRVNGTQLSEGAENRTERQLLAIGCFSRRDMALLTRDGKESGPGPVQE